MQRTGRKWREIRGLTAPVGRAHEVGAVQARVAGLEPLLVGGRGSRCAVGAGGTSLGWGRGSEGPGARRPGLLKGRSGKELSVHFHNDRFRQEQMERVALIQELMK